MLHLGDGGDRHHLPRRVFPPRHPPHNLPPHIPLPRSFIPSHSPKGFYNTPPTRLSLSCGFRFQ